ncbi:MFS transporter [Hazenella coriacea]|uniref:Putative MFS family arabinose efflux permease n=1 Tax=Hazenella coriacea TaxID=1179467 RepID=A0A4R3LC77_9BACL|nr:MFS transporter [Hazenella coriacea]TCS96865.1 putative MFS family arabinose efflux permease [Hazenella coriacea]
MVHSWSLQRFRLLVIIVGVAGLSQGLLIPLLATMLEEQGISPSMNGISASALYIGILCTAPFCEPAVKRFGYKSVILTGLLVVAGAIALFPVWTGFWAWTLLRFIVGIGDSFLHYATQLWITSTALKSERGKRISQYGFCYGLGFGLGPLGLNLLYFGTTVPFIVMLVILGLVFVFAFKLDSGYTESSQYAKQKKGNLVKLTTIYKLGLIALCPALLYGFLEAAIAGNFPIYGLQEGISKGWISILISTFVWGSLLFQVPLGMIGDRWGRKRLLISVCAMGAVGMAIIPFLVPHVYLLLIAFVLVGGLLGSLFSLGLAYMTDILPVSYLAKGNMISSVHFSIGSICGPFMGGVFIQHFGGGFLFSFIAGLLVLFVLLSVLYRKPSIQEEEAEPPQYVVS